MSVGTSINILEMRLEAVRHKIHQVRLDALGRGTAPGGGGEDPSLSARMAKLHEELGGVPAELKQIGTMLSRIGKQLDDRERVAWHVGREHRYRLLQSLGSHAERQREVYQLLRDIVLDLEDLSRAAGTPTRGELAGATASALHDMSEFAHDLHQVEALIAQPSQPTFLPPASQTVNVAWGTLLMMAYLLVLGVRGARRSGDKEE